VKLGNPRGFAHREDGQAGRATIIANADERVKALAGMIAQLKAEGHTSAYALARELDRFSARRQVDRARRLECDCSPRRRRALRAPQERHWRQIKATDFRGDQHT
jgi:hypothetical protein